jgi:methylglutaconyl-CoA hydratase
MTTPLHPESTVEVSHDQRGVWRINLNRPQLRNAFNSDVIRELHAAFDQVSAHPDARVVVLGGHGKAFCAGGDLNMMRAMADCSWEDNRAGAQAMADMMWAMEQCPVPIIARVHGDCYAGGMGLAALADMVVTVPEATFCLSEVRLGLIPATISPYVVRAMGQRAAQRYFVTAERFTAQQAADCGFVHAVVTASDLDDTVNAWVDSIVNCGPQAVRLSKQLIRDVALAEITPELRADTARRIADIRATDEGKEGVSSFLEKRQANWVQGL